MCFLRSSGPKGLSHVLFMFAHLSVAFAASVHYLPIQHCPVKYPDAQLRSSHEWLHEHEFYNASLWNSTTLRERRHHHHRTSSSHVHAHAHAYGHNPDWKRQATNPLYTVDTYMHIVQDNGSANPASADYISDAMVSAQFTYLAHAYTNVSIGFRLMGTDRTTNDSWAANGDDFHMKSALRRGTYASLNIYYQSRLQSAAGTPGVPAGSTLLGYCSLPAAGVTASTDPAVYVLDGCNVLSGTMPGGVVGGYNLGGTTAHEVGHWNGLLHTFQDNTCGASDFGDYVADTPQEMTSTNGCPIGKDTCPTSGTPAAGFTGTGGPNPYGPQGYSGPDPIHNFMDYSTDACYEGFTAGQGARMLNIWQIYRQGL